MKGKYNFETQYGQYSFCNLGGHLMEMQVLCAATRKNGYSLIILKPKFFNNGQ